MDYEPISFLLSVNSLDLFTKPDPGTGAIREFLGTERPRDVTP